MTRLWRRREDDARRTKGDPPPTYGQLQTTVDTLTAVVKQQGEIVRNLRSQCDGLSEENTLLRNWLPDAPVVVRKPEPELGVAADEVVVDEDVTRPYVRDAGYVGGGRGVMMSHSAADFDQADALLDAVRLHITGDVMTAGVVAIPAIQRDPIQAGSFLISLVCSAVRAYAHASGSHDPVGAVDELWRKPARDGVS